MGFMNTTRKIFNQDNVILKDVQKETIRALHKNKNVIVLSPCGSGKTEAAYLASKQWGGKTIYALPMKTLATTIQKRLNTYETNLQSGSMWTLQHSSENEDPNLSNDLVVTTIDQVLSGYLGFGRESAIRGANVMMSHLVLDEIQLFDTERSLLSTFSLLDQTVKSGHHFMLMTATMPDYLMNFIKERYGAEIVMIETPQIENRKNILRVTSDYDLKAIKAYEQSQIIVCNTQREQIDLMEQLDNDERIVLLNSKLLPSDRAKREADVITYFGKNAIPNNKILIATQIIEAGMDISSSRLWSTLCPIDSLIQREGRLNRWGGEGDFIVVTDRQNVVYDETLVAKTNECLQSIKDMELTWEMQLDLVNEILGEFYEKATTIKKLRLFEAKLKKGSKNDLIRSISQVTLILSDTHEQEDFDREGVSVHPSQLSKIKPEKIYILEKGRINEIQRNQAIPGDTLVITGLNCLYDAGGFRAEEGNSANEFPLAASRKKAKPFEDYVDETWLEHSKEVERMMTYHLLRDGQVEKSEIRRLSLVAGLHDLGKLTTNWQDYIGQVDEPMAHRPWKPRNYRKIKGVKHNIVSGLALKNVLTKLELNLLLQHHGRVILCYQEERIKAYEFVPEAHEEVYKLGWVDNIGDGKGDAVRPSDLISPGNKEWGLFLYLLGTLMKADREAIESIRKQKTLKNY